MQIIFVALLLFFSPSVWAMGQLPAQKVSSPALDKTAPDVLLSKTDGTTSTVIGPSHGKKVILVFWATWCPHCYEEMGFINDNIHAIEQKGFNVILVDVGEAKQDVKDYLNKRQFKMVSFVDENSYLLGVYHINGIPTIDFIDENGLIRNVTHTFPSDYENYFK